jgi:hypothetical protein
MQFLCREHSGANQAHLAYQHVEKLRKLIQAEFSEDRAGARDARIIFELEVALEFGSKNGVSVQYRIRIAPHGPELQRVKLSTLADNPTAMKNRPAIVNSDKKADD